MVDDYMDDKNWAGYMKSMGCLNESRLKEDVITENIQSAWIRTTFDTGKKDLESQGYKIISLEQNAGLRIQMGHYSTISGIRNLVREGIIYTEKGKYLTKKSPIIDFPEEATEAHRNHQEFYLTEEQLKSALEDSITLVSNSDYIKMDTIALGVDYIAKYMFGKYAQDYGVFLRGRNVPNLYIFLKGDFKGKPFARPICFNSIYHPDMSRITDNADMFSEYFIRGIKEL